MRRPDFASRIEKLRRRWPRRIRMAAWMLIGYVGVALAIVLPALPFLMLLCVVISLPLMSWAGPVTRYVALALIALVYVVGMWRARRPWQRAPLQGWEGHVVTGHEMPQLNALIERIRIALDVPSPKRIRIHAQLGASLTLHRPRRWWKRPYEELAIGLPLLILLPVEQVAAVIAHEFGHLSGLHGRFFKHVYQMRQHFPRVLQRADANKHARTAWLTGGLRRFLRWYLPRFDAETFALGRAFEYAADQAGASVTSPAAMAGALLNVCAGHRFLDGVYWPLVGRSASQSAEPEGTPYRQLLAWQTPIDPRVAWWLDDALCEATSDDDTHPGLADRLRALGMTPDTIWHTLVPNADPPAPELIALADEFDRHWRIESIPLWRSWREDWHRRQAHLHELQRHNIAPSANASALARIASLQFELGLPGWMKSIDDAWQAAPEDTSLAYECATRWLIHGIRQQEARDILQRLAQGPSTLAWRCHRILSRLAHDAGEHDTALHHRQLADKHVSEDGDLRRYMSELRPSDHFIAPALGDDQHLQLAISIESLRPWLRQARITRKAWPNTASTLHDARHAPIVVLLSFKDSRWERLTGTLRDRSKIARQQCIARINNLIAPELPFHAIWHCVAPTERWPDDDRILLTL